MAGRFLSNTRSTLSFTGDRVCQRSQEATQHALDLLQRLKQLLLNRFRDEGEIEAQDRFAFELAGRSDRDVEELAKLRVAAASAALRDVRADRDRRATHLALEAIFLCSRIAYGHFVNRLSKPPRALPDLKVPEVLHTSPLYDDCVTPKLRGDVPAWQRGGKLWLNAES